MGLPHSCKRSMLCFRSLLGNLNAVLLYAKEFMNTVQVFLTILFSTANCETPKMCTVLCQAHTVRCVPNLPRFQHPHGGTRWDTCRD